MGALIISCLLSIPQLGILISIDLKDQQMMATRLDRMWNKCRVIFLNSVFGDVVVLFVVIC